MVNVYMEVLEPQRSLCSCHATNVPFFSCHFSGPLNNKDGMVHAKHGSCKTKLTVAEVL